MKRAVIGALLTLALASPTWAGGHACTDTVENCKAQLAKDLAGRGWLGIKMEPREDGTVTVVKVVPDSPAQEAGLKEGDVLVALGGARFGKASEEDLEKERKGWTPGTRLAYTVLRDSKEISVPVKLAKMPDSVREEIIAMHVEQMHSSRAAAFRELSVEQLAGAMKDGKVAVFDVNTSTTRDKFGVVPQATLLTSASEYDLAALPQDKETAIVFYCANTRCTASDTAAKRAVEAGWKKVAVLRPGIAGWAEAGQKVSKPQS